MCFVGHNVLKRKSIVKKIDLEKKANLKQKLHKDAIKLLVGESKIVKKDILTNLLTVNDHIVSIGNMPIGFVELKLLDLSTLQVSVTKNHNSLSLRNC